jgi:hypothetical protein
MKSTRHANLVIVTLDADDLLELVTKVTERIMESDTILIKMHDWETNSTYANYLEVLKELHLLNHEIPMTLEMATEFSDELVSGLFANESIAEVFQMAKPQREKNLKLARICVDCQEAYISDKKGHNCDA